jgi:hypothetical protein
MAIRRNWLVVELFLLRHGFDPVQAALAVEDQHDWRREDWLKDVFGRLVLGKDWWTDARCVVPTAATAAWRTFAAEYAETSADIIELEIEMEADDWDTFQPNWQVTRSGH